jgi:hypothetical protein
VGEHWGLCCPQPNVLAHLVGRAVDAYRVSYCVHREELLPGLVLMCYHIEIVHSHREVERPMAGTAAERSQERAGTRERAVTVALAESLAIGGNWHIAE